MAESNKMISSFTNTLNTIPDLTSTSSLANLKLLLEMENGTGKVADLPVTEWYQNEVKALKIATKLLQNPQVEAKYGNGFQAASQLAGLVKRRVAQKEFELIVDSAIDDDVDLDYNENGRKRRGKAIIDVLVPADA